MGNPQVKLHSRRVTARLFDAARKFGDLVVDRTTLFHKLTNLFVFVHHCGVVPVAKKLTYFRNREIGHLSTEIHRDLPSESNPLRT